MAVVKANYVKRGGEARNRAKATIRYIQQRPGKEGEKLMRQLFGADGTPTREQAYRMIDQALKGTYFYRIVISPDPNREDGDLTLRAIATLEEKLKTQIPFAAAVHADHAPHRHVHVLALLEKKLTKGDINALRQEATRISLIQRRIRDRAPDRTQTAKHNHKRGSDAHVLRKPINRGVSRGKGSGVASAPPRVQGVACPRRCGGYAQTMDRLSSKIHRCPTCGIIVRKEGTELVIKQTGLHLSQSL